jgi:hypothetical protein
MAYQPDTETLLAVILGAALATAGGFSERQIERAILKKEKERSAALFFGELLSAMRIMMKLANEARSRGDPFGPITLRFMRSIQREVEIYDRNRETLLDLRSASVRASISVLIARLSFAVGGVTDATAELATLDGAASAERRAAILEMRKAAFDFAVETGAEITPLLEALAPLAHHNFGSTESAMPAGVLATSAGDATTQRQA